MVDVGEALRVGVGPFTHKGFSLLELGGPAAGPLLKVGFKIADDSSGQFFRVLSSTFGLLVPMDPSSIRKPSLPVVRVEFERTQVPPAHVHFHTSSQTLGWLYGIAGGPYRRAEELHFPVGSRRFRPTIEEFLLFLDRERIFRGWHPGGDWKAEARQRINAYEHVQAVSTVRDHPHAVAAELTRIGWTVAPPPACALGV